MATSHEVVTALFGVVTIDAVDGCVVVISVCSCSRG